MKRFVGAAVLTVLAAACGSTGVAATRPTVPRTTLPRSSTAPARTSRIVRSTTPSPKAAAMALARRMVDRAILPGGAVRTSVSLPAELRGPWEEPAGGNLVSAHRTWFVAMNPDTVVAFLKAHAPAGFVESGVGTFTSRTTRVVDVVDVLHPLPANVSVAGIEIGVERHGAGSLVNVLAGAQWTQLRPPGEHVGARDGVVVVSLIRYSHSAEVVRRVVVAGAKRSAIVSAFNALAVSPPLTPGGCFALGKNSVSYRVAFARSASAVPDVVATIAPCSPIAVRLGGHPSVNLTSSGDFGRAVAHVLGAADLTFSSAPARA